MNVYIVWILPAVGPRYIDSIWAAEQHSNDRQEELKTSMSACGSGSSYRHAIHVQVGKIADAVIPEQ